MAGEAVAHHLICGLDMACRQYEIELGQYPPGDGSGSRQLAEALSQTGPRGVAYYEFQPGQLLDGHIRNPVRRSRDEILHYRRNFPFPGPNARSGIPFEIWGRDSHGDPRGLNNWE